MKHSDQSNKITSYFKISSKNSKMNDNNKPKQNIAKNDIKIGIDNGYDSDCFIIDEKSAVKDQASIENIENLENSTEQNESFPEDDLDESFLALSQEENDLVIDTAVSSNIEQAQEKPNYDYSTKFFVQMVNNFLSNPELHYLFDAEELKLFQSFINLTSPDMKTLFVHIYWLQWRWHKVADVVKKYLNRDYRTDSARQVLRILEKGGFLLGGSQMDLGDWLSVLTLPQLYKICKHIPDGDKGYKKKTRAGIISLLEKVCSKHVDISKNFGKGPILTVKDKLIKKMNILFGSCIKVHPSAKTAFDVLHTLMYMGTNPQILREKRLNLLLLTVQNGQQHYPAMDLECDSPKCIYPTRLHFLEYVRAQLLAEEILKMTSNPKCNHEMVIKICRKCYEHYKYISEKTEFKNWLPPPWLHRYTPGYQYVKAMEMSLASFKASRNEELFEEGLNIVTVLLDQTNFRQHKRALWYSEQSLILHVKLKHFKQAAEMLILALNDPDITEDEKAPLRDRATRLAWLKKNKIDPDVHSLLMRAIRCPIPFIFSTHITARVVPDNVPGRKARYFFDDPITGDRTYTSVEDYALLYYMRNRDYNEGDHWEGRIIISIFALVFWDIIYNIVEKGKGIFLSPYQEMPLDMHTNYFYENRKGLIDERLEYIKTSNIKDILDKMKETLDARTKGDFSLLSDNIGWEQMSAVVECLGPAGLHSICKRLSQTYHYAHSGFPDLTMWNSRNKTIKFVEVKGDGDKLSFKQVQWILYLMESNIDTEVCYIHKNEQSMAKHKSAILSSQVKNETIRNATAKDETTRKATIEDETTSKAAAKTSGKDTFEAETTSKATAEDETTRKATIEDETTGKATAKDETTQKVAVKDENKMTAVSECIFIDDSPQKTGKATVIAETIRKLSVKGEIKMTEVSECIIIDDSPDNDFIPAPSHTKVKSSTVIAENPIFSSNDCLSRVTVSPSNGAGEILSQTPPPKSVVKDNSQNVSPAEIVSPAKRKLDDSPDRSSSQPHGVYLRSPTKFSKGVGYFVSPSKSPKVLANSDDSPRKYVNRRKISLSLSRRRLMEVDK